MHACMPHHARMHTSSQVGLIMQFSRIGQERIASLVREVDVANDRLDKDEFRQAVRKLGGPLQGEPRYVGM